MRRTLLLALSSLPLAACSAPTASVTPILASIGLDGELNISDQTSGGSANSTFEDLGVDDNDSALGGVVRIGLGGAEVSIAALELGYRGEGTTQGEFELGGQTIGAAVNVDTDVNLQMARGLITWDLVPIGGVDLGLGLGATLIDLDFSLQEIGGAQARVETSELIPIPLLAARAAWTWGPVNLRGDVGGLIVEYSGDEATVLDGQLSASVDFLGVGDLVVGYRITSIDAEYEDNGSDVVADFDLEGYFFGLRFGF